jgi:hypothetical protein
MYLVIALTILSSEICSHITEILYPTLCFATSLNFPTCRCPLCPVPPSNRLHITVCYPSYIAETEVLKKGPPAPINSNICYFIPPAAKFRQHNLTINVYVLDGGTGEDHWYGLLIRLLNTHGPGTVEMLQLSLVLLLGCQHFL